MDRIIALSNSLAQIMNSTYDKVNHICEPFFRRTPINYFEYVRFYDSGEMLLLGTHPEGMLKAFISNLFPSQEELNSFHAYGIKVACLSHDMELPAGVGALNSERYQNNIFNAAEHNVFHRIYFIERCSNYYKIYGYGVCKSTSSIMNYYLNSMPVLEKFVKHFEWRAQELIGGDNKENIIVLPNYHNKINAMETQSSSVEHYYEMQFQGFESDIFAKNTNRLTSREKECLSLVAQGYTMKNTARKLKISPRTVEQHLRNIKDKYGLHTKNQLVEIWHEIVQS